MKWVNASGLDAETYHRLCTIGDYLSYERHSEDYGSITWINNPVKYSLLQKRHRSELSQDPVKMLWSMLGTSVHETLHRALGNHRIEALQLLLVKEIELLCREEGDDLQQRILDTYKVYTERMNQLETEYIAEERLRVQMHGVWISGMNDLYHHATKKIADYKVTGAWKIINGDLTEWEAQLNGYAYLRRCHGYDVERLEINALLRDWSAKKAKFDRSYPDIPYIVIPINIWSFEEQKKYFEDRVSLYLSHELLDDDEIPECSEKDRWENLIGIAVLEVDKFIITNEIYYELESRISDLQILNLKNHIGEEYVTRYDFLHMILDETTNEFVDEYGEQIVSVCGIRSYTKDGEKYKRALVVKNSLEEVYNWISENQRKREWMLEYRYGGPTRCLYYCGVRQFCHYWRNVVSVNYDE